MPLWKCQKCHHEWEASRTGSVCDWCLGIGRVLQTLTPFEKLCRDLFKEQDDEGSR